MAKCIMVQGTCSNAGKSLLCAALCRIFKQDGYRVAPFKSQNMALNSFITADGKEMGRAQVVQAEAAGLAPDVRMNPVLLKPTSDVGSQVIVMGEARGNRTAREYWGDKRALIPVVRQAYDSLAAEYDIIVIEGAGSPAEINLKQDDIVNMGLARLVDAPVLLVGDIDRGGVFASLYGTVKLLDEDEQARIRALIINKFRGDVEILRPGLVQLEELTGKPVAGVVPYGKFDIDDEDSLSERLDRTGGAALVKIAVVRLPRLSNFTDFSALSRVPGVGVSYADKPAQLADADLIILPGTKATLADLRWLRESGMEAQILKQHAAGTPVFGVCGGYQIMGRSVSDPVGAEGGGSLRGMGLLPIDTVCGDHFGADAEPVVYEAGQLPDNMMGMDIGPKTFELFSDAVKNAGTVVWNGPMGVFEFDTFAVGTKEVAKAIAASGAVSIIGGGDSAAAVEKLGFADEMTHISTGGGASLEFLEGLELPGIACLQDK